jgi:hypothetical protein
MATRHPRLGLARDPQLERALAETRPLLSPYETRSLAAHVRALALRGADSVVVQGGPQAALRRDLAKDHDVIAARLDPHSLDPPPDGVDPGDPTPASDALRWVRGD